MRVKVQIICYLCKAMRIDMIQKIHLQKKYFFYTTLLITLLCGCANMAQGPTGGKKDMTPPQFVSSTPEQNGKNVKDKHIEIFFDEYLQLSNPSQNIVVSPPQKGNPSAKAIGKKVIVELKDSLIENTTYTIDFGNSIGDFTENNIVRDYCHTFSTGDVIDSFALSGIVLNAKDLTPAGNVTVGIYSSDVDSLFKTTVFERIARTNANGEFVIKGAKQKQYYIYAVADINNNYRYDQVSEEFAFQEQMIPIPSISETVRFDTLYKDSAVIDTILRKVVKRNLPDSIFLRLSAKEVKLQELNKTSRPDRKFLQVLMNKQNIFASDSRGTEAPVLHPVNFESVNWYLAESNPLADTVKYWITDTTVMKIDSLQLAVTYLVTDSAETLVEKTDTLYFALSKNYLKQEEKATKTAEARKARALKMGKTLQRDNLLDLETQPKTLNFNQKANFSWEYPTTKFSPQMCHLYTVKDSDTVAVNMQCKMREDLRTVDIDASIVPEKKYLLVLDSAAAYDYFDNHNDKIEVTFSMRGKDEYGTITINLKNAPAHAIVQLIDNSDRKLREEKHTGGKVQFTLLDKGVYYVRLFNDANGNGRWDPGDYEQKRQPEEVYYYGKQLKVRQNWEMEEDWNVTAAPLHKQRPSDIKSEKKNDK